MNKDVANYADLFRSRMEPMAMRELYVEQSGVILADKERADMQIVGELRSLHSAYCKVYDEWIGLTDRRPR